MRIRVVTASSPAPADRVARGLAFLSARGHDVVDDGPRPISPHPFLNGSDEERLGALSSAVQARGDAVWFARGGYGLGRVLDDVDIDAAVAADARFVGFSDVTALFCALQVHGQLARAVHAPLVTSLPDETPESVAHLDVVLSGKATRLAGLRAADASGRTAGRVEGTLFAGNLCVLASLCGTRHAPQLAGHIVVLEDIGERPYRIDRMLTQLLDAGVLAGAAAVVAGHLTGCDEKKANGDLVEALPVFQERMAHAGIPLFAGARVGHESPNFALPLGRAAALVNDGDGFVLEVAGA